MAQDHSVFSNIQDNRTSSLAEQVADQINQVIIDQNINAGEKLPNEFELAARLNVGRGTIREAVKLLVARNCLEIRRGKGTFVVEKPGQIEDPLGFAYVKDKITLAVDLMELRLQLEPWVAQLAAQRIEETEKDTLRQLCEQVEHKIRSGEDHGPADKEFHAYIARCTHNSVITEIMPVSGAELERRSIENAKRLGVRFVTAEAVGLTYTDKHTVETIGKDYPADAVILATGASRAVPRIPGLAGLEGHGVSWCAVCDAFFYRGKDVAVLGSGAYALHEVQALLPVVKSVSLLTNGMPLTAEFPPEVTVYPQKVEAVLGEPVVTGVQLSDGQEVALSGVFVALGVAGSTALARKIGAAVEGSRIVVDEKMQTTVPGLYAAGDCTGGLLQVAKAVYEGAQAGTEAAKALRKG